MDVNKTLISTAMLTAIFEKTKKGNVELLCPFILHIISKNDLGVDDETIIDKIETEFSFSNFPHAVLNIIINILKKDSKIEKIDKKYIITSNAKIDIDDFNDRYLNATKESKEVIDKLWDYLQNNTTIKTNYNSVKIAFASFLDRNGYIIYNNFDPQNLKIKNKDRLQFFIAKFIQNEFNNSSHVFNLLINIIEGLLLSNVIYLQITPDSSSDLNKLNCYFDSPFLLRLIEFKEKEDNVSANELVELLKKQGAKIKCFKHSFDEVQSILRNYINNKNFTANGKTLEALDSVNYNDTELNELYLNLEEIFNGKGIIIEEKPDYEKKSFKDSKYEDQIDETKLRDILLGRYTDKEINSKIIDNDIDSVSAIMRLRGGKKIQKFEDCNSIFITSNYDIRTSTRQLLNIDEKIEISPVIGDIDLTAIIWLRTLKDNPDLPKDKLIENARAALKPTQAIIEEFNKSLDKIKKTKYIKDGRTLQALIYTTHFSSQFMDEIEGEVNKVNPKSIIKVFEKGLKDAELIKSENNDEKRKNKVLQAKNDDLANQLIEKEKKHDLIIEKIIKKYELKIDNLSKKICFISKWLVNTLIFIILIFGLLGFFGSLNGIKNNLLFLIYIFISLYSLIGEFFNISYFFSFGELAKKFINTQTLPLITKYYRKKTKKDLDYYFNEKK